MTLMYDIGDRLFLTFHPVLKPGWVEVVKRFEPNIPLTREEALIWYGVKADWALKHVAKTARLGLVRESNGNLIVLPEVLWHTCLHYQKPTPIATKKKGKSKDAS